MALVEGVEDFVTSQYGLIRTELKLAISESGYTMEQVATLAGVSVRALQNALNGTTSPQIDTLLRVGFIVGAGIELIREDVMPSFRLVPLATGRSRSTKSRELDRVDVAGGAGKVVNVAVSSAAKKRKAASRQRKSAALRKNNRGCGSLAA